MLTAWEGIEPQARYRALTLLFRASSNWSVARVLESSSHAAAVSLTTYYDRVRRVATNLKLNPHLLARAEEINSMSDEELAQNTIVARIAEERQHSRARFQNMLNETYNSLDDREYRSSLRCKRCGSIDVNWDQKQTRGADEAMTVFCVCAQCGNRWKMS